MKRLSFKNKIGWATILVWAILCLAYFYIRTAIYLSGPQEGDLYSYTWSFQALGFSIAQLLFCILALGLVLFIEAYLMRDKK